MTSNYDLSHNIYLDAFALLTDLEWDLSDEETIIYYTKTIDGVSGSIIVTKNNTDIPGDDGGDENTTPPALTDKIDITSIKVLKGNEVITAGGSKLNRYVLGNNNVFTIEYIYTYSGNKKIIVNSGSLKNTHNEENKKISVTGNSPSGNGASDIEVSLTLSAEDSNSVKRIVYIGRD